MTVLDLYGPWDVAGYEVRIDCENGVRLTASRGGERLKAIPAGVRESHDFAWIKLAVEAATQHRRQLRTLLETAMVEGIPLSAEDLAMLALDPVGRPMLASLVVRQDGVIGRPLPEDWTLESLGGDFFRLAGPVTVVHPVKLHHAGTLERWNGWLNRQPLKQPFRQIRRELYLPNADDRATRTFSDRFAGETVRWDQARALLEGRGWYRVTKTGAERQWQSARLTGHVEFRTPAARSFSREDVVLARVFFLPRGEQVVNRANPGLPLEKVSDVVFSETLRDVALAAAVARRLPPAF
jgi:hypothetical protein